MILFDKKDIIDNTVIDTGVTFSKIDEALRVTLDIVDNLDEESLNELLSGSGDDIDQLLRNLVTECYASMYGTTGTDASSTMGSFNNSSIYYMEKLSETVEKVLRTESLTYFLISVLPEFELNWHHIEWAEAVQHHKYSCFLAARDHGKCLSPETPIRMFDGSIKRADEIKIGDLVMGPDSKSRTVLSLHSGEDTMYTIKQTKGDEYIVNSKHTLTLFNKRTQKIEDVDLPVLLSMTNNALYETYRGFKICTDYPEANLRIEPYFLGVWLGDGHKHNTAITTADFEVVDYLKEYADRLGLELSETQKSDSKASDFKIKRKNGTQQSNQLTDELKSYNLLFNKHIPKDFLVSSQKQRLELLAGLIDSDGNKHAGGYHFTTIYKHLAEEVKNLADGLGFKTHMYGGVSFHKQLQRNYESYSVTISGNLFEIPVKIARKKVTKEYAESKRSNKIPKHIDGIKISQLSRLHIEQKIEPGTYVGFTIDGDQRFLLGDGTVTHNSYFFSNAYLAWRLFRYNKHSKRKELSVLGKEGYLFSFSKTQAIRLLRTLKETIEESPILRDLLYPGKDGWADTKILCKNGSRIIVESAGASTRGAHPGFIVVDDFLKDNVLYSEEQRTKYTSYFHSVIMNMIQPGGYVTVVGTPFHSQDLYGDLKSKNKVWHVREYPSIFPDGRILWSNRYSFENLMEKKESQGSINFSREHLVRPITNDSSIFPFNILERSLIGMQNYTMVHNIESFPKNLTRVCIGVDLAISSNIGADYTVFTVGGLDEEENIWILKVVRLHGKSYGEQIAVLKKLNVDFRPNIIQVESNAFQMMFAQAAEKEGLPIMEAPTTAKSKNDMKTGLPGLALMFEKGKVKIPIGDQFSRDMKDLMFAEFSSITWTSQGLKSASDHDDMVMSMHQLLRGLDYRQTGFGFMLM